MIPVEAYVLAGGKSTRMGKDKGLSTLHAKYMVQHTLDLLQALNLPIKILASLPEYEQFGYPIVKDLFPDKGPLGGLFTALQTTQTEHILLLSCDMPLVKAHAIQQLIYHDNEALIVHFSYGKGNFPFPGRYHTKIKNDVLNNLKEEKLKMMLLLEQMNAQSISIADNQLPHFANVNCQQDLEKIEREWLRSE